MKHIKNVSAGDILTLKDEQTLEDSGRSVDLTVQDVLNITQVNDICKWTRIRFRDSETVLIVKEVEDEFDVRACFVPEGYVAGNREDLKDSGWLDSLFFQEESDIADYTFNRFLTITYDDTDVFEFKIKGGTLYGEDNKGRFCGVAEWATQDDSPNPEIIVFEIGGEDADHGGYIDLYQGVNLFPEEYEVL